MKNLKLMGRRAGMLAVCGGIAVASTSGLAQEYPAKPVKLVVGYAAGGATDLSARMMADALSRSLGQTFIVENKPGANSNIGAESVVRSLPMAIRSSWALFLQLSTKRCTNWALMQRAICCRWRN